MPRPNARPSLPQRPYAWRRRLRRLARILAKEGRAWQRRSLPQWAQTLHRYRRYGLMALLTCAFALLQMTSLPLWPSAPALAATGLSIEPLAWDFIGLDSNNVTQGPNQYLTGARVCNIGAEPAQNLKVRFVREGATNPYLTIVNSLNSDVWQTATLPSGVKPLNHHVVPAKPANCFDAYYIITVSRTSGAYDTVQRYRIEAVADNAGVVDTNSYPDTGQYDTGHPRQLYVEKILSQARNDVLNFENLTNPGNMTVEVGGTYTFRLTSQTATAYPQLTISSDFPNIVFQILNVSTTYSSDPGLTNSSIYTNACGFISDPSYPGYHTSSSNCDYIITDKDTNGDGKVGNTVVTNYTIKVLSTGPGNSSSQSYTINHLILDFSGGSYHYNADYGSQIGFGSTVITVVDRQADLSLTKTHSGNFVTGNNTYTLTVTNNGSDLARGPITVTDTLPTGFSYVSASGGSWSCAANGQIVTCTNPSDLAALGSSAFTLTVNVGASAASNSVNTATVSSPTRDPNASNNSAADPTTIIQGPNIQLAKTHSPATLVTGSTGTYTLTVSNSSGFDAVGPLTLIDTLPTGLTYSAASGTGWSCSANGQTVTCANPSGLNNGQTSVLTLTVNVNADVATPSVTNTATVSSGSFDTNTADNTASDPTNTSKPVPDLIVSKTDNNLNFAQSAQGTYTITVTNQGVASTNGTITVVDTLPASFTYVSATSANGYSGWTCSFTSPNVTCTNPGPLTPSQISRILLTVTPTTTVGSPFTNNVSVSTPGETNTGNNTGSDSTSVVTISSGTIDLNIAKTVTTTPTGPNTPIQYQIDITNNSSGNGNDTSIAFNDVVPASITGVTWTCNFVGTSATDLGNGSPSNYNSCNNGTSPHNKSGSGNTISLGTISLRKGAGKVRFVVSGTATAVGSLTNTATTTPSDGTDKTPADNVSSVTLTTPGADLSLGKTAFSSFAQNVNSVYRLTVTNTSGTLATSQPITVKDVLPASLTYVSAASASGSSGWSCTYDATSRTVTCVKLDSVSAGGTSAIDITVTPTASGSVSNNATVSSPGDTNAANNTATSTTTVATANPDLAISKADGGNFALGQQGTYSITVSNVGTTVAVAPITVTDTLPAGLSFLSGSGNGWVCSASGQTVTCTNYSNLAPSGSTVLNLKVLVGSTAPATVSNTATVATVSGETVTANNTSNTLNTAIAQRADLSLTKTLVGNLVTGQLATYQLRVTNQGPSPSVAPLTVTDTLPSGVSFVSGSGDGFSCTGSSPMTCTRNTTLAVGASATITLNVSVSAAGGATVVNSATVSGTTPDPTSGNNSASTSNTVQSATQALSLNKSHFGSFPMGGQGTYTLAIRNTGNVTITDTLKITDTLPGNLSLAFAVGEGWTCAGTTAVTCTSEADLAPGASNAVDLTVNVGTGTPSTVTNTASVFIGSSGTASASATDPTTITASADLSLTKTAATGFVVGQQAQYQLVVTNAASSSGSATSITLEDQLPTGLTYVSATGTGWSCPTAPAGPDIACTLSTALAPGASSTLTVTVQVTNAIAPPFTNFATVYSPTPDPNTSNNTATVTNNLGSGGTADVTVTKTDDVDPVAIGSALTYTVTARNGDATTSATGVTVTDTLPGGVTFVSATPAQGTCSQSDGTITCNLGTIPASGSVAIAVRVTPQVSGTLVNTATVASSNDSDPTNNSATQETSVVASGGENIISGRVFLDSDGNGTLGGAESGTANITVWLYEDLNDNGTIEPTDKLVISQVSNPSGDFSFAVKRTGKFLLTLDISDPDLPAGHTITTSPLPRVAIAVVNGSTSSGNNLGHVGSISSKPELLLVKRITAINGTSFSNLVDGINTPGSPNYVAAPRDQDDNHIYWPSNFLRGQITADIQPRDTVEFTIYFLSSGATPAQNALFCDLVPANVTFIPTAFNGTAAATGPNPVPGVTTAGGDRGIVIGLGTQASTNPYPIQVSLSNSSDGDVGQYVAPGIDLTTVDPRLSSCGSNTNGAIVTNLGNLPQATSAGNPPGAYGFVRFQGRVN